MKVKVRFYSRHREIVGKAEGEIEVEEGVTINNLMEKLIERYPELEKIRDSTLYSLNHRYAKGDERLKDGDEMAIFPPVEGG